MLSSSSQPTLRRTSSGPAFRAIALAVIVAVATPAITFASVGPKEAAYIGGTIAAFSGASAPIKGSIRTAGDDAFTFESADRVTTGAITVRYARVTGVEYGQKAGRRVGAAIGYTILAGPAGLLALLSKKRRHYVTVAFTDEDGHPQVAVFEVGKAAVRATLAVISSRSGNAVIYQDADARRSAMR